jgi:hypothetical protein
VTFQLPKPRHRPRRDGTRPRTPDGSKGRWGTAEEIREWRERMAEEMRQVTAEHARRDREAKR